MLDPDIYQILITSDNKIPDKLPDYTLECIESIKKVYSKSNIKFLSGDDIENIIKNNFSQEIFIAYQKFIPYAYKCDIARLCVLYLYGGMYIDLDTKFLNKIPFLNQVDFFAFRDIITMSRRSWSVSNSIIYAKKGCPILTNALDKIVKNCNNNYYGISPICPSGPIVLGKSICSFEDTQNKVSTEGELLPLTPSHDKRNLAYVLDDGTIVALRKPYRGGEMFINKTNNYYLMWHHKKIYRECILNE